MTWIKFFLFWLIAPVLIGLAVVGALEGIYLFTQFLSHIPHISIIAFAWVVGACFLLLDIIFDIL